MLKRKAAKHFSFFTFHLLPFVPSRLVNNKLLSPFRKTNKNKRKQSKTFFCLFLLFLTWVRRIYQTQKKKFFSWIFSKDYLLISEGACDWNLFENFLLIFYCWFYLDFCIDFKIQSENHEKIYSKILWGIKKSFRSFLA